MPVGRRSMSKENAIFKALRGFAASVDAKTNQVISGEPEDQIRGPFESFIASVANVLGSEVVCTGETPLPERLGRPDYAVHRAKLLAGYVELKAPGVGATSSRFKGHNKDQFRRFSAIPNILYTDGNEWALYRSGKLVGRVVRLPGDVATEGADAVDVRSAQAIEGLLRDFLDWKPLLPMDRKGQIDLKRFAALLAPLCRMLREDVTDALKNPFSPLVQLARDWRQLLFPGASDEQFADAYAQTVAFALLLGRSEGADPLTLTSAEAALAAQHSLLSRALQVLTDPGAREEMTASLDLLLRVIAAVPPAIFVGPKDPWLYFYEDFLATYDPKLRKDVGAYYTPIEVVHCQVRLIDDLLVNRLNKPLGFADSDVVTLDPSVGTGTYLLGVIEHALNRVQEEQGEGAVAGQAATLAKNLYGFELMVGPYAVAELRISRALRDRGASLPSEGTHVYLTDTLESPHAEPLQLPLFLKPISEQHAKALKVKSEVPVIVCLGNPPYDRHEAATGENKSRTGGWVRWGDQEDGSDAVLRAFVSPAIESGYGVHIKNLYNLYVYFWRWALWKVFEHTTSSGPGVVSLISASSYIDGDAFCGMREHMRRQCDEIWVLDLGGEGRGTRKDENIFVIQTPVAISVAVRTKKGNTDKPAKVHYTRITGTRKEKLGALENVAGLESVRWEVCPDGWHAPFRPAGQGDYFKWPLLTDLMPWQHSGVQVKRTWPIGPDPETLKSRWRGFLQARDRAAAFKETRDRKITHSYPSLADAEVREKPLADLAKESPPPIMSRYAYRSFDRQWILADSRVVDYLRPDLWRFHGDHQLYFVSLFSQPLGPGPALTSTAVIPDLDYFRGSYGAKAVIPLYRTAEASTPNILPGLLALLTRFYDREVTPEDFVAYIYGALAQPSFTGRYSKELETREVRVPLTKNPDLFESVRRVGARLIWLHTYGERFVPSGEQSRRVPRGSARCTKAVPDLPESYPEDFQYSEESRTLRVGKGEFAPVSPEVFHFEVSGLKVVQSWLRYRMKEGAGKKSSPLDEIRPERWTSQFTTELLEMLWVLEATVAGYPEQSALLDEVVQDKCFLADELPPVPESMRRPPGSDPAELGLFD
jgi:hypothetical protein